MVGFDFLQDGGGDFFNRLGGGGQPADARAAHHCFGFRNFHAAIFHARIFGVGPPFCANFSQSIGVDAQPEDFFSVRHQGWRKLFALKVFRNQWVIGRFQAVLHRQIEAGRCFSAATDADQNDIGRFQIAVRLTIVVGQ